MKKLFKLLLVLLIPSITQACLWLEGTTIDGEHKTFEDKTISSLFLKSSQHTTPQKNFKQRFYRENNQTIEYLALQAIMQGNYDQGIEKLLQMEDENQNLYATASNLGTAYELKGDNVSAIKWIKEGINRDAFSHYGTEWLHLLILETKLQLESNSTLLKNNHEKFFKWILSRDRFQRLFASEFSIESFLQKLERNISRMLRDRRKKRLSSLDLILFSAPFYDCVWA